MKVKIWKRREGIKSYVGKVVFLSSGFLRSENTHDHQDIRYSTNNRVSRNPVNGIITEFYDGSIED